MEDLRSKISKIESALTVFGDGQNIEPFILLNTRTALAYPIGESNERQRKEIMKAKIDFDSIPPFRGLAYVFGDFGGNPPQSPSIRKLCLNIFFII